MTTESWVHRLNAQAQRLDEWAAGTHPAAWPALLKGEVARWKRLAGGGPR